MRNLKKNVLCAVLACFSGSIWSMDLVQCYQAALDQDSRYKAARASADVARESLPQAKAQLLPNVSLSLSRYNNQLSSTSPNAAGNQATTDFNYPSHGETLTLRQPLYRKFLWDNYQQAQALQEDAEATLATELQNLLSKVAAAYFDALLAEEQHALVKAQLASFTLQLDGARKLFKAGTGTRTDIDEVQSRLDMAAAQELETRQNITLTRRQLQIMVNQPVDKLAPVDTGKLALATPQPNDLAYWTERAENNSPEIRSLKARLEVARLDIEKARSGHTPTLDALAQWSRSASENIYNTESSTDQKLIGLQLTVPIYAGGGVDSSTRQALAAHERALQTLEASRRELGLRVQKEFQGMSEGVLRVKALTQAVNSAEQALKSSQKSFEGGSRTRIDVLNAENNKMTSMRDLTQARHAYLLAQVRLHTLVDGASTEIVAKTSQSLKSP